MNTNATPAKPEQGVTALEQALRQMLGAGFDDELRSLVEGKPWYSTALSGTEVFQLWVRENIETRNDSLWVFQALRASERKQLLDQLGVDRAALAGKTPQEWANQVLDAIGLPRMAVSGTTRLKQNWIDICRLVSSNEDEKAAVLSRQRAERTLRTLLLFYVSTGHINSFTELLIDPGSLNLPRKLQKLVAEGPDKLRDALAPTLQEDGWADLGFLILAVRKFSSKLEKEGATNIFNLPMQLFSAAEQEHFTLLSTALQAYAHDKPSAHSSRRPQLEAATQKVAATVDGMIQRNIIPDEMLVLESCRGILGPEFRGVLDSGNERKLVASTLPPVGRRILFLSKAAHDYAPCIWIESPWPP